MKHFIVVGFFAYLCFILVIISCAEEKKVEQPPKYKKGDAVCVVGFPEIKGYILYGHYLNPYYYTVVFKDKNDKIYQEEFLEGNLTTCL